MTQIYTPDAYNQALPLDTAIAGYMHLELQALKKRLNDDLGQNTAFPTSIKLQLEGHGTTLSDHTTRIEALEEYDSNWTSTWSTFSTADAQWKSDKDSAVQSMQSKLQTAEQNIATLQQTVTSLQNQINALPVVRSGTGAPSNGTGKNGDIYYRYE